MFKNNTYNFFLLIAIITLSSCVQDQDKSVINSISKQELDKQLMEANRQIVLTESKQIDYLIERYDWEMQTTGTGLRYWIYEKSNNTILAKDKDVVKIAYEIKLITGDIVYTSDKDGFITFELGKSEQPSGLQEAIRLMHKGDKAKLVIPSHLAYGLVGDGVRIPAKASLIYHIELLGLKKTDKK